MQKTSDSLSKGPATSIKLANRLLANLPIRDLDPQRLLDKASRRCGLPAIHDAALNEGLEQLCSSLNHEASLNPIGRFILGQQLVDSLVNRLQVQHWHQQHPDINETIRKPLIVVGLPRTGTTLLSNLLDLDPHNRSLYQWQADSLVPPPTLAAHREDPRITESGRRIKSADWLVPSLQSIHPIAASLPCECISLFEDDFRSIGYDILANVPSFWHWRDDDNMQSAYNYHKQVLQMLQHTIPTDTWCLKTPGHLWHLPALLDAYPDATLIFTHRDLTKVIPSSASLARAMRSGFSDNVDCLSLGQEWMDKISTAITRATEFEDERGSDAFCHIQYPDLISDPVAAIETIYQTAGREVSGLFKRNIRNWMEHPPANKHGKHHYNAEDFGVSDVAIREQFSDYYQRYNVTKENS